jgi:hypothetical protein
MIYLTFLAAFLLSAMAAYYSVIGLAAIFMGAFWPVVAMGSTLEFAKLVTASWLYRNWNTAPKLLKLYLTIAVVLLMLITSMGIFGFLSKSHIDSTLDAGSNSVELKTLTQQETIAKNKLDYLLARAKDPSTASNTLDRQIQNTQRELTEINKKKLPLLKQENLLVAEVGPIKYVADIFFGEGDGALDKAVRLVIFAIMLVFDPLAVLLLIAGNISLRQRNEKILADGNKNETPKESIVQDKEEEDQSNEPVEEVQTIEIKKENIAAIQEGLDEAKPQIRKRGFPNRKSKELEPKYDYDAEYAFREKENK